MEITKSLEFGAMFVNQVIRQPNMNHDPKPYEHTHTHIYIYN